MIRLMRPPIAWHVVAILLILTVPMARADNLLKNADFKEGSQLWRGDAQEAYLKPDGTEGSELDKDAVPVLRVSLSHGTPREVYQEFRLTSASNQLHVQVEIYASIDFKRSAHTEDYQSDFYIPNADFSYRMMPDYSTRMSALKPGEWTTVKGVINLFQVSEDRSIHFCFPPGEGVVYIKNPSLTP